ncbi:hypothetical protein B0H19DRAFT_427066 [Mycena capillaripes]|nr:hypothetical protein B0H19DRAFT_427066 [Mycena capillaripes]
MFLIAELPQDVLLELAKQLNIADLFGLLSLCRVIREVQFERTLWVNALIRLREVEMQPLPLSTAETLETLSLQQLQNAAQRANRLMLNFTSDRPRPVRTGTLCPPVNCWTRIFCIPGANLALVHDYNTGWLECWDVLISRRMAYVELPGLKVRKIACMDIKGKALFSACIGEIKNLVVISIDFCDRAQIGISHVISPPVKHAFHNRTGLFINAQVMGFCTETNIISWDMNANSAIQTTPLHLDRVSMRWRTAPCLPIEQNLYVFCRGAIDFKPAIQTLSLLASSGGPQSTTLDSRPRPNITLLNIPYSNGSNPMEVRAHRHSFNGAIHVLSPHFGIFAVTIGKFAINTNPRTHIALVHFWAGRTICGILDFGEGCFYQPSHPIYSLAVGASGTNIVLCGKDTETDEDWVGLLHFNATPTPHTTFRRLDLGDLALSDGIAQIVLDDSLGLVFVVNNVGQVSVLSYV